MWQGFGMSTTGDSEHRLQRIAAALETVSAQLSDITAQLREVAAPGAVPPAAAAEPIYPQQWAPPPPVPYGYPGSMPPPSGPAYGQPVTTKSPAAAMLSKQLTGSRVLVWLGGAITLVGVVLMLILAIQAGLIGPVARVILGGVLAGALVAGALWVHRSPLGKTGSFALAATGIAVAYLDIIAATTLLDLVPPWAGLAAGLLLALGGLLLAARWEAQPLALFVLLGIALCAPIITAGFDAQLLGFLLVLQVATVPLQLMRGWMWVPLAAGIPPILVAFGATPNLISDTGSVAGMTAALVASLLTCAIAVASAVRRPRDVIPVILLLAAALPTFAIGLHVRAEIAAVALIILGLPVLGVWIAGIVRPQTVPTPIGIASGGLAALCALVATAQLLPGEARGIVLLGEAALLALAAAHVTARGVLLTAIGFTMVGTLFALAEGASPARILLVPRTPPEPVDLVLGALAFAMIAVAALAVVLARVAIDKRSDHPADEALVTVGQLLSAGWTLYGVSGLILSLALLPFPDRLGFLTGHTVVTISWVAAALVLLQCGVTRNGPRIAGFVLVGAALLKLVLFDLGALDGIARVATFLGAGLILLIAGVHYVKVVAQHAEAEEAAEAAALQHPQPPAA